MTKKHLKKVYLAIPYSGMHESSYEQSTKCTAHFMMKDSVNIYSPITHSHAVQENMPQSYNTWEFWGPIDLQYVDWADEVWVLVPREGWETVVKSKGVQAEIEYARENDKPVKFLYLTSTYKDSYYYAFDNEEDAKKYFEEI